MVGITHYGLGKCPPCTCFGPSGNLKVKTPLTRNLILVINTSNDGNNSINDTKI